MKEITLTVFDQQYNAMCSVYRKYFDVVCDDDMRVLIANSCGCVSADDVTDDQLVTNFLEVNSFEHPLYNLLFLQKFYDGDLSDEERILSFGVDLLDIYRHRIDRLSGDDADLEDGLDDGGLYYTADGKVFIACDKTFEPEQIKKDLGMSCDPAYVPENPKIAPQELYYYLADRDLHMLPDDPRLLDVRNFHELEDILPDMREDVSSADLFVPVMDDVFEYICEDLWEGNSCQVKDVIGFAVENYVCDPLNDQFRFLEEDLVRFGENNIFFVRLPKMLYLLLKQKCPEHVRVCDVLDRALRLNFSIPPYKAELSDMETEKVRNT